MIFAETYGRVAYAVTVRLEIMRDLGAIQNPFGAFLLLQGLETLSLRGQRHNENTLALAKYLESHEKVAWVSYPGLKSHESHELANRLFRVKGEYGGVLTFGVKGGQDPKVGAKVVDSLMLASNLANVGEWFVAGLLTSVVVGYGILIWIEWVQGMRRRLLSTLRRRPTSS